MRTTVQTDAEALELGASVFDLKLRAVMCVPLVQEGQAQAPEEHELQSGVLYVDSKRRHAAPSPTRTCRSSSHWPSTSRSRSRTRG